MKRQTAKMLFYWQRAMLIKINNTVLNGTRLIFYFKQRVFVYQLNNDALKLSLFLVHFLVHHFWYSLLLTEFGKNTR
jgi:hypothetical protein